MLIIFNRKFVNTLFLEAKIAKIFARFARVVINFSPAAHFGNGIKSKIQFL